MIDINVNRDLHREGWPRTLSFMDTPDGAGECHPFEIGIDRVTHPASWEQLARTLETAAKVIRRDILKEAVETPAD